MALKSPHLHTRFVFFEQFYQSGFSKDFYNDICKQVSVNHLTLFRLQLMRILAKQFGFEVCDKPESACAGDGRTTMIWQMTKTE